MLIFLHENQASTDFQITSAFELGLFTACPVGIAIFAVVIFLIQKPVVIQKQFGIVSARDYFVGNIP